MALPGKSRPYWTTTAPEIHFPPLTSDLEVEVAIVGGGIVGVTAARILKDMGVPVAVVEAARVGRQVTGRSTAKITSQHGIIYQRLLSRFGEAGARTYAEANQQAVGRIRELAEAHGVDCDLEPRPALAYTRNPDRLGTIESEVEAARRLGLPASLARDLGLPFAVAGAVRFEDQAQFHPCKYVAGLARTLPGDGSHVFENTRVLKAGRTRIETERGTITARQVILATHLPLGNTGFLFGRAFPFAHPMVAARLGDGRLPEGMFISIDQPTHSFRTHGAGEGAHLVAVGASFTPGHPEEERRAFAELERFVRDELGAREIDHRWTNEDYAAEDGVPFIGRSSWGEDFVLVATGFDAWGITGGTVAATILADLAAGRTNPWASFFDARRIRPVAGGPGFLKGNLATARHLVEGWARRRSETPDALRPGEAGVFRHEGRRLAVHRDEAGRLHAVSAVCTHLGCILGWNETERSWDCPCHGSRFSFTGDVLHGPAVTPLERHEIGVARVQPNAQRS